ncbi:MAG: tetratricopeptide repeat protein [Liquorilactobacillus ghanensis]|uniref:tetratricopeptide repeat protein n=1 Tax=Liquorilactobacillus ghanensis TaxID=399370 RepID=UPI0039EA51D0
MEKIIKEALELRKNGKLKDSNKMLVELYQKKPEDAYLNYQIAWSYDILEKEIEAIPFYEKAIQIGLRKSDLQEAYLGLGSTYRALGEYDKSYDVYQRAINRFPDNAALQVFYSMTLFNLNKHEQAMKILLNLLVSTSKDPEIKTFEKSILFYADKLNQRFS